VYTFSKARLREADPTSLRLEFDGMKGRSWLMKWLPARAYDNGAYAIFSNPIGLDDDQLKNGCSMIIDPFGDILEECHSFDNSIVSAIITPEKLASGRWNLLYKSQTTRTVQGHFRTKSQV
jgi:beta-ureidopropionase